MHEQMARVLYHLQVHLLYASMVWAAAWLLTSIPRGSATTKYWIWVVTSLNFIVPTGGVLDKFGASHFTWARPLGVIGDAGLVLSRTGPATAVGLVWLAGAVLMFTRLGVRLGAERRRIHAINTQTARDRASHLLTHGVPLTFSDTQAPAVDGILHPRISLPNRIDQLLTEHELDAVLVHEVTHARRRDNLIRLVYEVVRSLLWFHPLVWIAGGRLGLYRELSCDEPVIQSARGGDLISALAKLANPEEAFLLQASASSFITHRLAKLAAPQEQRTGYAVNTVLTVSFSAVLIAGVFATVAHTACCWLSRR